MYRVRQIEQPLCTDWRYPPDLSRQFDTGELFSVTSPQKIIVLPCIDWGTWYAVVDSTIWGLIQRDSYRGLRDVFSIVGFFVTSHRYLSGVGLVCSQTDSTWSPLVYVLLTRTPRAFCFFGCEIGNLKIQFSTPVWTVNREIVACCVQKFYSDQRLFICSQLFIL